MRLYALENNVLPQTDRGLRNCEGVGMGLTYYYYPELIFLKD